MNNDRTTELLSRLPPDWWKDPMRSAALAHWFQRHLIALQVIFRERQTKRERMELYTGFVVEHRTLPTWFTAGHNITQLTELRSSERYSVISARWCDNYPGPLAARGLPVDLERLPVKHLMEDVADVGFAWPSSELELAGWKANPNYHPLTDEMWRDLELAQPEGLYVVGYPAQLREESWSETATHRSLGFRVDPVCIPVVELIEPKSDFEPPGFWSKTHCYFGRLELPPGDLTSIAGLSGGPVLSIERTPAGHLKYRLVGVQSSWLPRSKIVRFEPIRLFVSVLDGIVDEFEEHHALTLERQGIE